jgi:hypothetical protein
VEESLALPDVLADAGAAVGALVCEAPLAAAGVVCAIAGAPKLAASKIAAMDPGVAVTLFTLVLFWPKTLVRNCAHRSLLHLSPAIATGWPNGFFLKINSLSYSYKVTWHRFRPEVWIFPAPPLAA